MSDTFDYINRTYGLSLKRGQRVEYTGDESIGLQLGTITGADGQYVMIRLDGHKNAFPYHPTWYLRYLETAPSP